MDEDFDATFQDRDGWVGIRDLLINWLSFATSREWRSTLRIHRSPQLRRILLDFMDGPRVTLIIFLFKLIRTL